MNKEQLKSLTVISLFISATLLAGIKFNFFENFKEQTNYQITTINLDEVYKENIHPSQMIANLGNGNITILYNQNQQYYNEAMNVVQAALQSNQSLQEVEIERYQVQQSLKSLEIKFDTPINSRLLSRSLFLNTNNLESLDPVQSILIPLVEDTSIYIKSTTKIYRLPLSERVSLQTIDSLNSSNYVKYYSLRELHEIPSNAMINLESPQSQTQYTTTPRITQEEDKDTMAQLIFGSKFNFTNKISEFDGSTSYTYNFGQEYLKFKTSGAIEYINLDVGKESENDFDQSIKAAANFLSILNFDQGSLRLEKISLENIQGKSGYHIVYIQEIDGYDVIPALKNQIISIQVIGNKVYTFKGLNRQTLESMPPTETLTPMEVIEQNYDMLQLGFGFETGEQLLTLIESIKQVYHVDQNYTLRACYQIQISSRTFYFDIATGNEVRNGLA